MSFDYDPEECTIFGAGDAEIKTAGRRIREGHLVSFPTETVFGLGADALNNEAAKRIYTVKGRPPTDPLIVHVTDIEKGMSDLWNVSPEILKIARLLFKNFSPGPLTLVAKANEEKVAEVVCGGSGNVGLRVPAHPVARALIDASGRPIAAPSANTFGHVSPTIAEHVYFDLASRDSQLTILDGGRCSVGVESTVARIISEKEIEILRRGAVSHEMMLAVLKNPGAFVQSDDENNDKKLFANVEITVKDTRKKAVGNISAPMAGPGQLLTHYSPAVPAYLIDFENSFFLSSSGDDNEKSEQGGVLSLRYQPPNANSSSATPSKSPSIGENLSDEAASMKNNHAHHDKLVVGGTEARSFPLSQTILVDYGDILAKKLAEKFPGFDVKKDVRAYKSLSPNRRSDEASREVFATLRWTEDIDGAQAVALPLVLGMIDLEKAVALEKTLLEAVEDRLFRAASGRNAQFAYV